MNLSSFKENKFEVKCRICGHVGEAKDFIAEVDVWMAPEDIVNIQRKEATLKCPNCNATETLPMTIW